MKQVLLIISLILGATAASADSRIFCECNSALVFYNNRHQTAECSHSANSFLVTFNDTYVLSVSNTQCDEVLANNITQGEIFLACNVDTIDTNGEQVRHSLKINRVSGAYEFYHSGMKMTKYGSCKKASNAF